METIKTALVVVLLLAVLYGVYTVLNKPTQPMNQEIAWHNQQIMEPLEVDLGFAMEAGSEPTGATPTSPAWADYGSSTTSAAPAAAASEYSMTMPQQAEPAAASPESATIDMPPPNDAAAMSSDVVMPPPTMDMAMPADDVAPTAQTAGSFYGAAVGAPTEASTAVENQSSVYGSAPATSNSYASEPYGAAPTTGPIDMAAAAETVPAIRVSPIKNALQTATVKIEDGEWYDALWTLSMFFNSPDLSDEERETLLSWLDPLAAKVVYSTEHLIEPAYQVQRGDSIQEIADRYGVPWQLLVNINSIENPDLVSAGTMLKVLRGPFRAEINLERKELTVFAGKLYAGRFPVTLGADPVPVEGDYTVRDKQSGRTFYAGDGMTIPVDDPSNPFGDVWLDLGSEMCIHGSPQAEAANSRGCISLSPQDANDLYGIISRGSTVSVRR